MKLFDKRTGMEVMDDRDCLALVGEGGRGVTPWAA